MSAIASNLQAVRARIAKAAEQAGRSPQEITLLAVSKTWPLDCILAAADAEQRAFGKNYVQEGLDKALATADLDLEWHFIGPLQSNKTRLVAEHFVWVHSLERIKIAERLSAQRPAELPPLQVCVQVNVGVSKSNRPSIAVLPFVNMSDDSQNAYLSDGLTEEILNLLVRLQVVDVAGRTSSFFFKGKDVDIKTVASHLGVTNVLEGSVRRDRERIASERRPEDEGGAQRVGLTGAPARKAAVAPRRGRGASPPRARR